MSFSSRILFLLACATFAISARGAWADEDRWLIQNGRPVGTIVLPDRADEQTRGAAEMLASYLEKTTGARLPLANESDWPSGTRIHVGPTRLGRRLGRGHDLGADGFFFDFIEADDLVLCGGSPWGTEFAVVEVLERFAQVRWLYPGESGIDVVPTKNIVVPAVRETHRPAFFSRELSGFPGAIGAEWRRRLRIHPQIQFHHSLYKLFDEKARAELGEKILPVQSNGERYHPVGEQRVGWQPCLSEAAGIKHVHRRVGSAPTYALGITDGSPARAGGFCRCELCLPDGNPGMNRFGYENHSPPYYDWVSRVAREQVNQDATIGLLAYAEVSEPPKMSLPDRVVPFLTTASYRWGRKDLREHSEGWIREWNQKAATLGIYDYVYGSYYALPRPFNELHAECLRSQLDLGIDAIYAEAQMAGVEGPKTYITLKQWWDPSLDENELRAEWCRRLVGEKAGVRLDLVYQKWEAFWEEVQQSDWAARGRHFSDFRRLDYLDLLPPETIEWVRQEMVMVERDAGSPVHRQRASELSQAMEVSLLAAEIRQLDQDCWAQGGGPKKARIQLAQIARLVSQRVESNEGNEDSGLRIWREYLAMPRWLNEPSHWGAGWRWRAIAPVKLESNLTLDPGFELLPHQSPWGIWPEKEATVRRNSEDAATGVASLEFAGPGRVTVWADVDCEAGMSLALECKVRSSSGALGAGTFVDFRMGADRVATVPLAKCLAGSKGEKWTAIGAVGTVPKGTQGKLRISLVVDYLRKDDHVQIDDFRCAVLPKVLPASGLRSPRP